MNEKDNRPAPKRQYPPFWEKVVPIALIIIVLAVVILLLVVAVALGLFPGAA
jgi:flagellar basal body-associated protein FliL